MRAYSKRVARSFLRFGVDMSPYRKYRVEGGSVGGIRRTQPPVVFLYFLCWVPVFSSGGLDNPMVLWYHMLYIYPQDIPWVQSRGFIRRNF